VEALWRPCWRRRGRGILILESVSGFCSRLDGTGLVVLKNFQFILLLGCLTVRVSGLLS
jgi:hypothetical protein